MNTGSLVERLEAFQVEHGFEPVRCVAGRKEKGRGGPGFLIMVASARRLEGMSLCFLSFWTRLDAIGCD